MRHLFKSTFISILITGLSAASTKAQQQPSLLGFGAYAAKKQFDLEATFDKQLQAGNLRDWMKRMTAFPHQLGSAYGLDNALFLRDKLGRLRGIKVWFLIPRESGFYLVRDLGMARLRLRSG